MDPEATATDKLAVLIDADNAQPKIARLVLAEIAKYGTAFVKRAYGDWTTNNLSGWKEQLLSNSIQPIQQFAYTQGKNSTDAAMVIDAMDLLYTNRFNGFCIVSSDSDFTRLASRIRESGLRVYGFGERKTPKPLVTACDKFIYTENLSANLKTAPAYPNNAAPEDLMSRDLTSQDLTPRKRPFDAISKKDPKELDSERSFIYKAIESESDDDGWASLARLGLLINKQHPDFDPRSFGYLKLSHLLQDDTAVETTKRIPGVGKPPVVYVRMLRLL
ncbi:unnamed protein product [Clonostachys chloroleuca]|uniref:HTH OST-type domain-containing protein n=1 Tax=Clonostachys chloroleuca TaxID=1926264 RepID=A0AA35Q662_9HYPO|nr:unnamed protein product [Clonostachys chloroleuca]